MREHGFEYEEEWRLYVAGKFPKRDALPDNIPVNPEKVYRHVGWTGWKDWLGIGKEKDTEPSPAAETEIMIDCKCRGRIENCPECDGKGYYYVYLR